MQTVGEGAKVAFHARSLEALGYLLEPDADVIILRATQSDIGRR